MVNVMIDDVPGMVLEEIQMENVRENLRFSTPGGHKKFNMENYENIFPFNNVLRGRKREKLDALEPLSV